MYDIRPNLIIGFHGCDKNSALTLLQYPDLILKSEEPHDWLGHGMYFWENNEDRAWQWAKAKLKRKGLDQKDAAVIGAVIQLGYCCDFLDSRFTAMLKTYYQLMELTYKESNKPLPENVDHHSDANQDKLLRYLDCTVIEYMHRSIEEQYQKAKLERGFSDIKVFESTRGVFMEGREVYKGAGIFEKNHIQICVRNPNCIKGLFLPRKEIVSDQIRGDRAFFGLPTSDS